MGERQNDDIFSTGTVVASVVLHAVLLGLLAMLTGISSCRSKQEDDVQIMDITVVLHENLDKPPDDLKPDDKPKPPPPPKPNPPKPKPVPPKKPNYGLLALAAVAALFWDF